MESFLLLNQQTKKSTTFYKHLEWIQNMLFVHIVAIHVQNGTIFTHL